MDRRFGLPPTLRILLLPDTTRPPPLLELLSAKRGLSKEAEGVGEETEEEAAEEEVEAVEEDRPGAVVPNAGRS